MNIYIYKDGQQHGPFEISQLKQYVKQGNFTPQDRACYDGKTWVTVQQVPGFATEDSTNKTKAQPPTIGQQRQPDRSEAKPLKHSVPMSINAASKKRKLVLWSALGTVAVLIVAGLLFVMFGKDGNGKVDTGVPELSETKDDEREKPSSIIATSEKPVYLNPELDDPAARTLVMDEATDLGKLLGDDLKAMRIIFEIRSWMQELNFMLGVGQSPIKTQIVMDGQNPLTGEASYELTIRQKKTEYLFKFKDGLQDGVQFSWHANGKRRAQFFVKSGKPHGKYLAWHENGNKRSEFNFRDGICQGLQKEWRDDGTLLKEGNYDEGLADGQFTIRSWDGKVFSGVFKKGVNWSDQKYIEIEQLAIASSAVVPREIPLRTILSVSLDDNGEPCFFLGASKVKLTDISGSDSPRVTSRGGVKKIPYLRFDRRVSMNIFEEASRVLGAAGLGEIKLAVRQNEKDSTAEEAEFTFYFPGYYRREEGLPLVRLAVNEHGKIRCIGDDLVSEAEMNGDGSGLEKKSLANWLSKKVGEERLETYIEIAYHRNLYFQNFVSILNACSMAKIPPKRIFWYEGDGGNQVREVKLFKRKVK